MQEVSGQSVDDLVMATVHTIAKKPAGTFKTIASVKAAFPLFDTLFEDFYAMALKVGHKWKTGASSKVEISSWVHSQVQTKCQRLVTTGAGGFEQVRILV